MSTKARITLGDGFVSVCPYPEGLKERLHYWRRELEYNQSKRKREMRTHKELLYNIVDSSDASGMPCSSLITMPGFAHRCIEYVRNCGWDTEVSDARTPMPAPDYGKAMTGLREYQMELVYNMLASGGGILSAATGAGKTHMMKAVCNAYPHEALMHRGTPTIVVAVPDKDITRKNWEDLTKLLPDRDVGLIMSGVCKPSDDIQVITLDSLHKLDSDDVGILLVDEVHTAASDTRAEELLRFSKALRWGVSATPDGRFDGKDTVTEGIFGPVVARFTYQDGVKNGALVPITVYWLPAPEPSIGIENYLRYKTREKRYQWGVYRNNGLNRLIAETLHGIPSDMQTLGMMQFTSHMEQVLRACHSVDSLDVPAQVHAGTSADAFPDTQFRMVHAISSKERKDIYGRVRQGEIRKIVSTHVYKQGVDFPDLRVVVNIGGGGSEIVNKQVPGRASRKAEGKDQAYIIEFSHEWDTVETDSGVRQGPIRSDDRSRRRVYDSLGFTQIDCEKGELPWISKATLTP